MAKLGVGIGLAKSVISPKGISCEFAKHTFFKGEDVSPIPFKEYAEAISTGSSLMEFVKKYSLSQSQIKHLLGLGFRSSTKSIRFRIYLLLRDFPHSYTSLVEFYKFELSQNRMAFYRKVSLAGKVFNTMSIRFAASCEQT